MAHTEALPNGVPDVIAAQIGQRLEQMVSADLDQAERAMPRLADTVRKYAAGGNQPSVGESFSFWMLDASSLSEPSEDLRDLAQNTGRWHHQIWLPVGGTAYARSIPVGDKMKASNWVLRELFEAVLSDRISSAIPLIDRQVPDNYVARLLSVPAYQLNVFWLVDNKSGDQKAMVLTAPETPSGLELGKLYDAKEFIRLLRSRKPIQGLIDDRALDQSNTSIIGPDLKDMRQTMKVRIQIRLQKDRENLK